MEKLKNSCIWQILLQSGACVWSKIAKFNWNSPKYGEILKNNAWVFIKLQKTLINILKKTSKTQFENIITQKTAQVIAWNSLDRRTKISPVNVQILMVMQCQGFAMCLPVIWKKDDSCCTGFFQDLSQLSNLRWIPNSVSKGFDTAMKTGSSRRFKW